MSDDKKAPGKFPQKMVLPDGTVFTAYGVSKASPPIKPISGHGVSRAPKPAPTTHKPAVPVDWSFWPASRRVTRDEAIALSLGLDPHPLYSRTNGYINPELCPDNATAILFLKRLSLLAACNSRTNILLSEIAEWAVSVDMTPLPLELVALAPSRQSTANDEQFCDARELSLNGALIDWDYWSRRTTITPQQAAELAHCVEPGKRRIDEERSRKIQRLAESLAEHSPTWTLSALVKHLGDEVPFNMKQAVASGNGAPAKVDGGATAVKDGKPEHSSHDNASRTTTHLVPAPKRTNILDAVIQLAKDSAVKATDWQSVWASLVKLAETKERPAPLLGFSDDEGVKYQDFSEVKFLSKKSFQQRWNRANPAR